MNITINTEIRHLPISVRKELADILDAIEGWKSLAGVITRSPTDVEPLYKEEHLRLFTSVKKSPTLLLLDDWGTTGRNRPTVQLLLNNLIKAQQFRAADYVAVDILKGDYPERPLDGPAKKFLVTHSTPIGDSTSVDDKTIVSENVESISIDPTPAFTREPDQERQDSLNPIDDNKISQESNVNEGQYAALNLAIPHISFNTLFTSTLGFSKNQKLGQGGFGAVYLGVLELNGVQKTVAVKRLNTGEETQFRTELHVMTRYCHENLLSILAFSSDFQRARCLIYAYMANGSLEDRLAEKNKTPPLPWKVRLNIAVGTARGLVALHTTYSEPLVHRDIKSANILLDDNFTPKIGDFGIARLGSSWEETTKILTSKWCGTPVYMADEALRGSITVKMDTYSFGIVLLELLTGLPPYDQNRSEPALLSYVDEEEKEADEWKDPKAGEWPEKVANTIFDLATRCTERRKRQRPLMEEIFPELEALKASL